MIWIVYFLGVFIFCLLNLLESASILPLSYVDHAFMALAFLGALFQAWCLLRYIWLMRKLKETGWSISMWNYLISPANLAILTIRRVVPKDEFQATPYYNSRLGELENLRICIKQVKKAKRNLKTRSRQE